LKPRTEEGDRTVTTRPEPKLGRRQLLLVGATVGVTTALGATPSGASARRDRIGPWIPSDDFLADLPRLMEVVSLPGLTMATVEDGKVVWTRAVGLTNVETKAPMREDSVFEAASMSKPVFAYVVLKLAEEGLIDLDRPLVQYLRPDYLSNHPYIDLISAQHVLCHSTGFPNWRRSPEEKLTPAFKPGTRFSYSGEAYQWLQFVVEKITGAGVDMVMRSRLFGPAQMPLSTFGWSADIARLSVYGYKGPGDEEGQLGPQYKRDLSNRLLPIAAKLGKPISAMTDEEIRRVLPEAKGVTNVAGMLSTTAAEYARFMTLVMDHSKRASWEFTETSRRAMVSQQMTRKTNALYWGLGWGLEQSPSGLLFYHSGNNYGIFNVFGVGDPVRRRAIVIFTNGGGGHGVYPRIVRAATGRELLEFLF
jgi:CubicO group peptidase (beta-lactamase class C family)